MKIAIIGSGISGLTCGYYLHKNHSIKIFEANDYIGGHTSTVKVAEDEKTFNIDTGFIVFNQKTYPNFLELLKTLDVPYQKTFMSFSVKSEGEDFEYNGTSLNSLFAQRRNLFRVKMYCIIYGIFHFNRCAKRYIEEGKQTNSFGDFLTESRISQDVIRYYVLPMVSAIWSADFSNVYDFPAIFLLRFWHNHGFLEINERPQWFVVKDGSSSYIKKMILGFKKDIFLSSRVEKVSRIKNKVLVKALRKDPEEFDKVIFANHSDQVLSILEKPSDLEKSILESIPFKANHVTLHTDRSLLPKRRLAWAAWNYRLNPKSRNDSTVTYNMNILQSLNTKKTYCVSLNQDHLIDQSKIIYKNVYHHPIFTLNSTASQERLKENLGRDNTYFVGAYLQNGFHEDGVVSAKRVVKHIEEKL